MAGRGWTESVTASVGRRGILHRRVLVVVLVVGAAVVLRSGRRGEFPLVSSLLEFPETRRRRHLRLLLLKLSNDVVVVAATSTGYVGLGASSLVAVLVRRSVWRVFGVLIRWTSAAPACKGKQGISRVKDVSKF